MADDVARRRRAELLTVSFIAWLLTREGPEPELEEEAIALLDGWGLRPPPPPPPPPGEILRPVRSMVDHIKGRFPTPDRSQPTPSDAAVEGLARGQRAKLLTLSFVAWLLTRDEPEPQLEEEAIALLEGWGLRPPPPPPPPPGEILHPVRRMVRYFEEQLA